jgi:phage shock protein PspC (stress-responsive transcriptional regulator)
MKKFYRSETDKKIFGVCSGLARYTNTDVALWRIGMLVGIFIPIPVVIFYLVTTIVTDSIDYLD